MSRQLVRTTLTLIFLAAAPTHAASTWTGAATGAGSLNWSNAANWGGTAPSSNTATDLIFAGTTNNGTLANPLLQNIASPLKFNSITFASSAGPFFLGGNDLDTEADVAITQSSSNAQNIANNFVAVGGSGVRTLTLTSTSGGTGIVRMTGLLSEGTSPKIVSLEKSGADSTYVLTSTNSYTGNTTIFGGALQANSGTGLPTASALILSGGVLQSDGPATFTRGLGVVANKFKWTTDANGGFAASGGTFVINIGNGTSAQIWASTASFLSSGASLILNSATADAMVDYQNGIVLGTGGSVTRTVIINDNPNSTTDIARISGALSSSSGTARFQKLGLGTLELTNLNNSYTGGTAIDQGVISISGIAASGSNSPIGTGTVSLGAASTGGTLRYTGPTDATNRLISVAGAGGGTIQSTANTLSLTGGLSLGANPMTFGGEGSITVSTAAIQGAGGVVNKRDAGVLTLSGGVTHTYTGATNVLGGTLVVNGILDSTGGLVTIGDGATTGSGTLKGGGTIQRSVTIAKGGSIAPGNSIGTLSTNGQAWAAGGSYVWELNDAGDTSNAAAGTNYDRLTITGALNVSATSTNKFFIDIHTLTVSTPGPAANFNKLLNYDWIIATANGGVGIIDPNAFDVLTDYVSNDTSGATPATNGKFSIWGETSNLHLKYSAAPEPTSLGLLILSAAALLGRRGRGKRVA